MNEGKPQMDSPNKACRERLADTLRGKARALRDRAHNIEQMADRVARFDAEGESVIYEVMAELSSSNGQTRGLW